MPISQFILNAAEQKRFQLRLRNKWMIRIRWYYVILLTVVVAGSTLATSQKFEDIKSYLILGAIALFANGLLWLAVLSTHQRAWYYQLIACVQVLFDLVLASWIVYAQGGLMSRTTVLYAIPIFSAGALFRGWFAYLTAIMSALFYTGALVVTYLTQHTELPLIDITVPAAFYTSVFIVLAAIVSHATTTNTFNERERSYNELLAMLRHQLYHPISVISALIEMLETDNSFSKLPPQDRRFLKQVKHENQRLHGMITNLLEAAETSKVEQMQPVNLITIVNDAAVDSATAAKRLNDLDTRFSGQALMVSGNAGQLRLVFDNIIDNAFRYSPAGTKVTVSVHDTKPLVEIDIIDSGDGMSAQQQKHLFERFTNFEHDNSASKDSNMYSLGLGLYVSKLIIERHGGEISVESAPQKGTSVKVMLKKGKL